MIITAKNERTVAEIGNIMKLKICILSVLYSNNFKISHMVAK